MARASRKRKAEGIQGQAACGLCNTCELIQMHVSRCLLRAVASVRGANAYANSFRSQRAGSQILPPVGSCPLLPTFRPPPLPTLTPSLALHVAPRDMLQL
jgi:hypothetical protein